MTDKLASNMHNRKIGSWGEMKAEEYLKAEGLLIICKNYYTREGEIDIVASEGDELVFVEVKTRTTNANGYPEEAVTEEKMEHLLSAAELFMAEKDYKGSWRLDVLAITGKPESKLSQFEWFKDVE